jgi:serine/threonine-protein kinase/endoribonuclease IRE1
MCFITHSFFLLLRCRDPNTGEIKWKQVSEPSVKTENKDQFSSNEVYFADPVSGSLYKLRFQDDNNNVLKKLPFTIPELVTKSPCKSSDGILYSGKKSDNW